MGFVYSFVAAIFTVWVLLLACAGLSFYWSQQHPGERSSARISLALISVVIGFVLLSAHLRWRTNTRTLNLSWLFVLPIAAGVCALGAGMKTRKIQAKDYEKKKA